MDTAESPVDPENRKTAIVVGGITVSLTRESVGSGSCSIEYFDGMKKRITNSLPDLFTSTGAVIAILVPGAPISTGEVIATFSDVLFAPKI